MISASLVLSNSSFVGSSAAGATTFEWQGGRTCFAMNATAYGSGAIYFQTLGADNATFINVAGPYGANQFTSFDLPKGRYKLTNANSSSVGVYAVLASVPY